MSPVRVQNQGGNAETVSNRSSIIRKMEWQLDQVMTKLRSYEKNPRTCDVDAKIDTATLSKTIYYPIVSMSQNWLL